MRLLDTAEIKDIQSLASSGNELNIRVNFYQRPYRWTAKKVTDLFEDYRENRVSALAGGNSFEYFLGAVVLVDERNQQERDAGRVWKYQVVDGQQRFTTLFLFNYIKYMLLIKKVDEAAQRNKSRDFNAGLEAMENCYKGFIGHNNVSIIEQANRNLSNAFDTANQNRVAIDINDLNQWRQQVGWIANPDISSPSYYEDCKCAMQSFIQNENICISYENNAFNDCLRKALTQIVIKFSDASDAAFCEEPIEEYDENDETSVEFPYVIRAYGIFDQIKKLSREINPTINAPYEKLCSYITLIDEMLQYIKLCMIVTSDEDDAYKLFETLNDRSESVNDLELLKNYFFKTYTETSGEPQIAINNNISSLDTRWRNIFFKYDELEPEIFEYMTVFFTGNTGKNTNERKRKLIKGYLAGYNSGNRYTYNKIAQDFTYMEYIQAIILRIHRMNMTTCRKSDEDAQMSLYIENDSLSSVVKRALGLAMNMPYPVVVASIICDIIHNFIINGQQMPNFDAYLNCVFDEVNCKTYYPGLWKDACVLWKVIILSRNFESPKLLSDVLAASCNINQLGNGRPIQKQLIQFDANILEEDTVVQEFDEWINEWKFSDSNGKIKIKNLFMHLFLKYDWDSTTDQLQLCQNIVRTYQTNAIKQDLDHMDARYVDRQNETRYFHYNLSDRTYYTNSLGNMMPLPVAINRGKHNTPMDDTIAAFSTENLNGWIFDMVVGEFNNNNVVVNGHNIPNENFFIQRKNRLAEYFKRVVKNQKFTPSSRI
ncbi:MAG: DUF262 domain-containing protein [Paludibacteraceae bacterium]|nr:DUF262 domain-containing protein [Paludibacteraceae bacterium]